MNTLSHRIRMLDPDYRRDQRVAESTDPCIIYLRESLCGERHISEMPDLHGYDFQFWQEIHEMWHQLATNPECWGDEDLAERRSEAKAEARKARGQRALRGLRLGRTQEQNYEEELTQ